ncbi:TPA: acyltransferase family protein [Citrobacter freundii]
MREQWVDYAKGIGIILVVVGHVNRGLDSSGIFISESFFKLFDSIIYSFHMPLFFFLSGLFFIKSIEKAGKAKFVVKKLETIAYPYVLWSIIQGLVAVLLSRFTNAKTDIMSVFSFPVEPIAQFWFLYALFMIFMVACIIYNKRYFTSYLPVITLVSFFLYIYSDNIGNAFHADFITKNSIFFFAGVMFSTVRMSAKSSQFSLITLAISFILFCAIQYKFHFMDGMFYDDIGISTFFVAIISIFFVFCLSTVLGMVGIEPLRKIGEYSMIIFLVHILAGSGTRIILSKFLGVDNWYLHIIVGTAAGVVLPIVFYKVTKMLKLNFLFSYPERAYSGK